MLQLTMFNFANRELRKLNPELMVILLLKHTSNLNDHHLTTLAET
uniref:Uncharacterized protein n=1 Tax=Rhizophora mucronata TaxID=61149 RepID=A0A2P2R4E5_RHIMU